MKFRIQRTKSKLILIAALLFSILFSITPLFAEQISFSADTMSGKAGSNSDTTTLTGNARVTTESMEVTADSIELSGDEFRNVFAQGKIHGVYHDAGLEFDSERLRYDRKTKVVVLSGNVKLIDKEHDVNAEAQVVEYNQETDTAVLQVEIKLTNKNNICSAAYAVYYKKAQTLELNGSAKVIKGDDSFRAQTIKFDLESEEIEMDGNVRGSVTDEKKNDDNSNPEGAQ